MKEKTDSSNTKSSYKNKIYKSQSCKCLKFILSGLILWICPRLLAFNLCCGIILFGKLRLLTVLVQKPEYKVNMNCPFKKKSRLILRNLFENLFPCILESQYHLNYTEYCTQILVQGTLIEMTLHKCYNIYENIILFSKIHSF